MTAPRGDDRRPTTDRTTASDAESTERGPTVSDDARRGHYDALTGADLIAAERHRQVEAEGWTPEHDAEHGDGDLAMAAVCYALPPTERRPRHVFSFWPWHPSWWKPTPDDRIRELVKAGALIAAEIDRLQAQEANR